VNRQAQAVVMLLFGGAVLKASLTDMYLRYVKEGLRPFLIAAALLLIATAVMTLWYDLRRPAPAAAGGNAGASDPDLPDPNVAYDELPDDQHGHHHDGHGHHEPRVGWLLILPVVGLLLVAPPALGSYAAGQSGSVLASQQDFAAYPPLPDEDPAKITVLEYASRAVFDNGESLGNRRVQLTGFIVAGPDGEPMLARIILSCCAADGRPIKVGLAGNAPKTVPADTWVELVGRYTAKKAKDPVNEATVPYLDVEAWREVPPPKKQYE
jgi:uncharacterized repeat protein (TIGR03943 family)